MATPLQDKLRAVAEEHLTPLLERRKELQAELAVVEAEIDSAEKAIVGASGAPAASKSSGKPKKRAAQKASAPRDRVLKVARDLLAKAGGKVGRKELLDMVKEQLREEGFGLTGLMQRFNKIVDEEACFVGRGSSVSLNAAKA